METKTGWRCTPAPLLLAFATWTVWAIARTIIVNVMTFERGYSQRLLLIGEGIAFGAVALVVLGVTELVNRSAGETRSKLKIAQVGVSLALAGDVLAGLVQFAKDPWKHEWVYKATEYVGIGTWLMFAVGLALALPAAQRGFGWIVVAVTALTWLPQPIDEKLWGAIGLEGKTLFTAHMALYAVRLAMLGLLAIKASQGETTPEPASASQGFRTAASGLWLRVIAACAVMLFTLMMIAGKSGGSSSLSFLKLLMMAQAIISVIALLMTGLGALRVARSGVRDIEPYMFALGGGASLWAAGVSLAQLPMVYKAFYGDGYSSGREMREMMEVLSVALPVIVVVGVGILATGLSNFAARRNNDTLRSEAQGKGIGYVVLLLVSMALTTWMVPKARSVGNFAMLSLLAAGASLWGTVMMAKLLGRGAEAIESEASLPQASVVNEPPAP